MSHWFILYYHRQTFVFSLAFFFFSLFLALTINIFVFFFHFFSSLPSSNSYFRMENSAVPPLKNDWTKKMMKAKWEIGSHETVKCKNAENREKISRSCTMHSILRYIFPIRHSILIWFGCIERTGVNIEHWASQNGKFKCVRLSKCLFYVVHFHKIITWGFVVIVAISLGCSNTNTNRNQ